MINIFWYDDEKNVYKTHIDALKSGKKCFLYYNDALYNKVDWKIEPSVSLDKLYKLRAQEIRDSYERVILCLSGGIDSRNVLETFYYNNIHIDEILSVGAFSQDEYFGSDENNNKEIYVNVKQLLNDLNLPNTKKTFIDYTQNFIKPKSFSLINNYQDYWMYNISCWKSPHHLFWNDLYRHIINDDKKTCWITGTGKTRVHHNEQSSYINFSETEIMDYSGKYVNKNLHRENFYWGNTKISTDIIKKQAHIMLNFYNVLNNKNISNKEYDRIYNKVIYNLKNPILSPTKKSSSLLLSIRDTFIKRKTDSEIYKYYTEGLKRISHDIDLNYKTYCTKNYYL